MTFTSVTAQSGNGSSLPYQDITMVPEEYTAGTVVARMLDGLGFRYYWATEGLRQEDLPYRPSEMSRSTEETLDHILTLSQVVLNAALRQPNIRRETETLSFDEKRQRTLENIKKASEIMMQNPNLEEHSAVFERGESKREYPFWNLINGPIADAIWHVGQVVSFRRSSGNPFNSNVSLFQGAVRQ